MRSLIIALAGLALLAISPAIAQPARPEIALKPGDPYKHRLSGLSLPAVLGGIPRAAATALTPDLDEYVNFVRGNDEEVITVYVFRHVSGSVPIWFDRVAWQIAHREVYGGATATIPAAAFVPPNQKNPSALLASYTVGTTPYRASAAAFIPLGPDWYVALRYSSITLDAPALDRKLRAAITEIGWPKKIAPQPEAVPLADCTTPLALSGEAEKVESADVSASILIGGIVDPSDFKTPAKNKEDTVSDPVTWCRDTGSYPSLRGSGIYRPGNASDRYLIAFGDAGLGALVAPDEWFALQKNTAGKTPPWSIRFFNLKASLAFAPRDRLPSPEQALTIVNGEAPVSTASTIGAKKITIDTSQFK